MSYILSILAGIVQGLTEFWPVSSSGHLIIFHDIFNFNLPNELLFDVMLHWGTLLALIIFFYREVWQIICGFFSSLTNWNLKNNSSQRLAWLVIVATIPAVLVGYFLSDVIELYFRSTYVVVVMLVVVAILFFIVEKYTSKIRTVGDLKFRHALYIGIAQILAFIPGTSRSGITMVVGLSSGLKRSQAARFSFIMAIPVIFGAGVKSLFSIGEASGSIGLMIVGLITSAIVGYFAIKFLLKFLDNHSLKVFAYYRLVIAAFIFLWLLFL
jgi:undecaprenyl-diphosphatase